ncbi:hypothetical protein [Candidatus Binatus sp.]|uniref:hypothetical protein n=1 Tax=Candidatus Binatus sp. TaxID=2811406 RepID=UPI003C336D50
MRTLVADDAFTAQLSVLGNLPFVDEVIRGVTNGIATFAEAFDLVPGFTTLRIAKTDTFDTIARLLPPLRIYFCILDQNRVRLMWIERIDDDPGLLDE